MAKKLVFSIVFSLAFLFSFSQEKEIEPPYNIKTVTFVQNGQNSIPIFTLGDSFEFQFDDLFGNEANYF